MGTGPGAATRSEEITYHDGSLARRNHRKFKEIAPRESPFPSHAPRKSRSPYIRRFYQCLNLLTQFLETPGACAPSMKPATSTEAQTEFFHSSLSIFLLFLISWEYVQSSNSSFLPSQEFKCFFECQPTILSSFHPCNSRRGTSSVVILIAYDKYTDFPPHWRRGRQPSWSSSSTCIP